MKNLLARCLLSSAIAFGFSQSLVSAAVIPVPNGDFESGVASRPAQTNSAPPSWTSSGVFGTFKIATAGNGGVNALSSYASPPAAFNARNHGELIAFAQGGATLSQTLTATYAANTVYTFSVLVGDGYEGVSGGYELRLLAGASTLLNTTAGTYPATAFTVTSPSPAFVTFDTSSNPSAVGQPITLQIFAATGASKTFDNVTLDAVSAIPEPGTYALLSCLGLVGFAGYRRKR